MGLILENTMAGPGQSRVVMQGSDAEISTFTEPLWMMNSAMSGLVEGDAE